ncbi:hypothetical protein [Lysinibacillus fusiformis]|uniref:hypothetical protein n=1 Tax=Lysinibacillus fusiformis TaxID=28031 RepID=UPI0037C95C05
MSKKKVMIDSYNENRLKDWLEDKEARGNGHDDRDYDRCNNRGCFIIDQLHIILDREEKARRKPICNMGDGCRFISVNYFWEQCFKLFFMRKWDKKGGIDVSPFDLPPKML